MNIALAQPSTRLASSPDNPCPDGAIAGTIACPDGVSLRYAIWPSAAAPRGTVCVFTGRSEAIEKYFETVGELLRRGFAVTVMDWRGQGHSARQLADPRKGHVTAFSEYECDVGALVRAVVLPNLPPPYTALAHSMGGTTMLRLAHGGQTWFDRLVLTAPMIDLPPPRSALPLRALMRALRRAGLGERYVPGSNVDRTRARGFEGNPLTTDAIRYARNAALFARDPALGVGSPTVAWIDAAFAAIGDFRRPGYAESIDRPVLMVAAGEDTVVSTPAAVRFAARLKNGACHVIKGARHEILQETDSHRAEFWAAFDEFMTAPG
jgi:lysophospholipase